MEPVAHLLVSSSSFLGWKENLSLEVSNKVGGRKVLEGKLSDSKNVLFRLDSGTLDYNRMDDSYCKQQ